jgi:tetratricopeptide (TPR) repeat protein
VRIRAIGPDGTVRQVPVDGRVVIGRSGETDLVLTGERVSRRHAAVELRDGRVLVEDLGSSNGTWIGGTRIAGKAEIAPGAEVRIGGWTVAMEVGGDETVAVPASGTREGPALRAAPPRRARRWWAAGAAVLVVTVAVGWARGAAVAAGDGAPAGALPGAEAGADGRAAAAPVPASAGAVARLDRWRLEVAGAKLLLAERRTAGDWAGAREALERLFALDPLEPSVPATREVLAAEERAAGFEARAGELAALGRDEEALALLLQIPRSSWHHGRARDVAARLLRERVVPVRRQACLEGLSRGSAAKALAECRRYLDLTCHERLDEPVARAVRRAERSRREEPWSCPRDLGAWLAAGTPAGRDDGPGRAVRERYADVEVAEALLAHFRDGRTRLAREAFERIARDRAAAVAPAGPRSARGRATATTSASAGRAGPHAVADETVRGLALRLEELDGRLVESRAKVLAGDLEAAEAALSRAAAIEAEILPEGPASQALLAGRRALAAAHRKRGEEHLSLGREGLAFAALEKALAFDPADPGARRGLEKLEARAASRLDRDPSCEEATAVLAITTAGGATHRRARERLAGPACRGVGGF